MEPHRAIYGRWQAMQLSFGSIAIPVAPSMEFSAHQVIVGDSVVEIAGYEKQEKHVTVHLKGSVSLTFEMETNDAMTIVLPVIGRVKYSRAS